MKRETWRASPTTTRMLGLGAAIASTRPAENAPLVRAAEQKINARLRPIHRRARAVNP